MTNKHLSPLTLPIVLLSLGKVDFPAWQLQDVVLKALRVHQEAYACCQRLQRFQANASSLGSCKHCWEVVVLFVFLCAEVVVLFVLVVTSAGNDENEPATAET